MSEQGPARQNAPTECPLQRLRWWAPIGTSVWPQAGIRGIPGLLSYLLARFGPVPRISAFYGIVIAMYFDGHPPPHFHAMYGEHQAQVVIATGEVLHGSLPRRALRLVQEWAELHRDELVADWGRAEREEPLVSIEPLP